MLQYCNVQDQRFKHVNSILVVAMLPTVVSSVPSLHSTERRIDCYLRNSPPLPAVSKALALTLGTHASRHRRAEGIGNAFHEDELQRAVLEAKQGRGKAGGAEEEGGGQEIRKGGGEVVGGASGMWQQRTGRMRMYCLLHISDSKPTPSKCLSKSRVS